MPSAKIISNQSNTINLSKTPYAKLAKYVPPVVNNEMVFDILDGNTALANAIRRTLISEMPMKHLTISLTDIHSTDRYVIREVIKKRVEMIPISQDMDVDTVFSVQVENNTDEPMDVLTDDIKINGVKKSDGILPMVPICNINSGTSFSLNDIRVITSYGYNNSRVMPGRIGYQMIDQDFSKPSMTQNPDHFRIEMEVSGVHNPKELVRTAIDSLMERLDNIDFSRAKTEFGVYKLSILNETHSIGKLISSYVYALEPTIDYVSDRLPHPSQREVIIDVRHPDAEELCKKAVVVIKKDLKSVMKAFE